MSAASLTLGVIHLFVWFKQTIEIRPPAVFRARGFGRGLRRLRVGDDARAIPCRLCRCAAPGSRAARHVRAVDCLVRAFLFRRRKTLARLHGLRRQVARARAEFRDRREHQLSRGFLAGSGDAVGGAVVSGPVGVANPWAIVPQIGNVLLVAFVVDASVTLWRRGGAVARRRAAVVGGSLVVCITAVAGFAALITSGLVHAPTIVMPGVFIVVLAMGYELGWDMIAAAQLAAQLRSERAALPCGRPGGSERDSSGR